VSEPITPSPTVGPFFAMRLPWPDGPFVVPEGTPGAVTIAGRVYDGAGNPIPDALIETWQADPEGRFAHQDDPRGASASGYRSFRGFGRCPTSPDGSYRIVTLKPGQKIDLSFAEHAGKLYQGTLVRTADAIDPVSRTLLVEVDVDNRAGELLPGSLAQVHFKTPTAGPTSIIPSAALIFRKEGLRVGVVVNGKIAHLVPVVIGEDDGANVQIVAGLNPGDQVIQDPPDSLIEGERVQVVSPSNAGGR